MTADEVLLGVALTLVLAVGSQVLASRLRIPSLVILLPVGFLAGALTDDVDPQRLLGTAFQPVVGLAVAVILYDAGLALNLRAISAHRRVVIRLIALGTPITWAFAGFGSAMILGLPQQAALMLGAILVVSGPTVVGPLLAVVRPAERLHRILRWEGTLIDPVGAILGAVVFGAIVAPTRYGPGPQVLHFLASFAVGLVGGALGTALLWLLLNKLRLGEVLGTSAQLAAVVAAAATCDVVRDDTGLIAAIVMGLAAANLPSFDMPARRPFFETFVQLILGVLFVSISATVAPQTVRHHVLPTLGLVALLVLVARPVAAYVATLRSDLSWAERGFIAWMYPRGIVAAATATTFSAALVAEGVAGASRIMPATFLVIVATVTLYGLTAGPVARRLGVTRSVRTRPLLVGSDPWVIDLGRALRTAGLDVLMWAATDEQRDRVARAGLELVPDESIATAATRGAQLEHVTAVLLLTAEDDFNALASAIIDDTVDGPVYRLQPAAHRGVVAPYLGCAILFAAGTTRPAVERRIGNGATILARRDGAVPAGHELLFRVRAGGQLAPVTEDGEPAPQDGDTTVLLGPDLSSVRDPGIATTNERRATMEPS
ncbi:cation:proton antiporter [Phytohabitans rumicis]|uniref:Cation:proton antiporter n=1 Tax=Phytohabitans rumicis TaxID=1076125 RepID=A0A6V8KT48_9ACTN|nr:cation:proton antiporter [Phytohabitans rumicis]GFJ86600.1 cation:proton antiporter [Phytohabitans rumicis]